MLGYIALSHQPGERGLPGQNCPPDFDLVNAGVSGSIAAFACSSVSTTTHLKSKSIPTRACCLGDFRSSIDRPSLSTGTNNATWKLSLLVQVVTRTDVVIAIGNPQRRTLDEEDG